VTASASGMDILHRYTRAVRYHAEDATTIREAVVAACGRGADLGGAYLKGAYLSGADLGGAYLKGADLSGAYLSGAYLRGAYLRGADLGGAYLKGAYLGGAYLKGADLSGAYLSGAYLRGALGIEAWRVSPLMMLLDQTGPIRAYKLVDAEGQSPMQSTEKLTYTVGRAYEVADANTNPTVDCGAGINVATMDWCLREYNAGWRVMVVEFTAADIACVPIASDGKFRLHRCTVVGEKDITALVSKPEVVS
jgi:hypothetical protein